MICGLLALARGRQHVTDPVVTDREVALRLR
jgi:hypothetical protein